MKNGAKLSLDPVRAVYVALRAARARRTQRVDGFAPIAIGDVHLVLRGEHEGAEWAHVEGGVVALRLEAPMFYA